MTAPRLSFCRWWECASVALQKVGGSAAAERVYMSKGIQILQPDWPSPPGVRAAFTLRTGGVSSAPYASLNLGSAIGDSPAAVAENRRRVRELLRLPAEPVWLDQVHGVDVVSLDDVPTHRRADAAVTHVSGSVCAVRVADCMPVLFAAADGSVVGAAHAGWRGLAGGVLEAVVARLGVPPSQLWAWMGPAIGPGHFEVGEDVRSAFMEADAEAASAFQRNERNRWQCDLYALARRRLSALGLERIYGGGWCTFAEADRFFSYRRDGQCGRMAALIWIQS